MLPVYFLASSFNGAMKKLEESLQLLQKNEASLRFWGVERSDDPNLAGDLLQEFGLVARPPPGIPAQGRRSECPARAPRFRFDARSGPPRSCGFGRPGAARSPPRSRGSRQRLSVAAVRLFPAEKHFTVGDDHIVEREAVFVGAGIQAGAGGAARKAHAGRRLKNVGGKRAALPIEFDLEIAGVG